MSPPSWPSRRARVPRRSRGSRSAAHARLPVCPLLLVVLLGVPTCLHAQRLKLSAKLDELERRAVVDSNDAAAHYNLALGYWKEKRWDDVEHVLKRATAIEFRFADAHLALSFLVTARMGELVSQADRPGDTTLLKTALVAIHQDRTRLRGRSGRTPG